ncbi:MAG: FliA/WhiG family RNA polymerase sigma factor [Ruminiclostridium sp.]|nr:FliA/WhiG family RNA polymerase sigma factor [Ruminiclostridium sp.]
MKTEFDVVRYIEEYRTTGNINLRNDIILRYLELVRVIAVSLRNIYSKYASIDDIINEGVIALMSAIDTFDTDKNVKFETYANLKVKGAIIDYVRKQDWVPRQVRRFGKDMEAAYNELYITLDRRPSNEEIAQHMGITKEKLARGMAEAAGAITLSFEELLYEDNFNVEGSDGADSEMYKKELKSVIAGAIDALKPKEKQVVTLYYYEKLKFSEIAKVLEVSESRVCQIHSKAMLSMKHTLQEYMTK